jgi:hypothetical protein
MTGILLLTIVVLGTFSFRYASAQNLQKADFQDSASRVAELLCQSWKGVQGTESFKPIESLAAIGGIEAADGFSEGDAGWPEGFILLGTCRVVLDSTPYYATLAYKDIQPGLRALTVMVSWAQRGPVGGTIDGGVYLPVTFDETDKMYQLTNYVNTD